MCTSKSFLLLLVVLFQLYHRNSFLKSHCLFRTNEHLLFQVHLTTEQEAPAQRIVYPRSTMPTYPMRVLCSGLLSAAIKDFQSDLKGRI